VKQEKYEAWERRMEEGEAERTVLREYLGGPSKAKRAEEIKNTEIRT
jgi:hypothetical protein